MNRSVILSLLTRRLTAQSYAPDTVKTYVAAVGRYLSYRSNHPENSQTSLHKRVLSYLSHRAEEDVSASTLNVEFNALVYFHTHILKADQPELDKIKALKIQPKTRIPEILTPEQVSILLVHLPSEHRLIGEVLYGTGLRLNEVLSLRLRHVDFSNRKLLVSDKKSRGSRSVSIPEVLFNNITNQYNTAVASWRGDTSCNIGVHLPRSLEKEFKTLGLSQEWYWLFPASSTSRDPHSHRVQRPHIRAVSVHGSFALKRRLQELPDHATPQGLRHAFATHLVASMLADGFPYDMIKRKLVEHLGRSGAETFKFYLSLAEPKADAIRLPINILDLEKGT